MTQTKMNHDIEIELVPRLETIKKKLDIFFQFFLLNCEYKNNKLK